MTFNYDHIVHFRHHLHYEWFNSGLVQLHYNCSLIQQWNSRKKLDLIALVSLK